ncbi:MAG: sporulation protein YtfJ [Chloroflexi bacterium]|nr:sporulation protein YtfJ [Chloroflexota bacterium]
MEDVEKLIKTSLEEIERVLTSKTVVGEPMTFEGNTLVPLVRIAFGFGVGGGAGGGMGKDEKSKGEGSGGAAAGGAWIKPVAVIVINKDGVKIEPITGATGSVLAKAGDIIGKVVEKRVLKGKEEKKEEKEG